jgi:phosphate transport system protein
LADEKYIKPLIDLPKMLTLGEEMCRDAVLALVNGDTALARSTAARDQEMDSLNKQVNRDLLALMLDDKDNIKQGTRLQFLSRFLERMGDHAVTICSWALYSIDGRHEEF